MPDVKELRVYPLFEPNDNTNVSCPLPLSFAFAEADATVNITLSPLDDPKEVEQVLYERLAYAGIKTEIRVFAEFFEEKHSRVVGVSFSFVSLTLKEEDLPKITVNSRKSVFGCVNLNSETDPIDEALLGVKVELNTIQNLTVPESFKIGYENLNIKSGMHFTEDFPLDVEAYELESSIFDLFGWGCTITSNIKDIQVHAYHTYEDMDQSGARGELDLTTSFCGHASLRAPGLVWISRPLEIDNSPFQVSTTLG